MQRAQRIARRIFDSRTPGYEQIGTVWLPLPHLLMLPFVGVAKWWSTGLAGAFAGSLCFVTAGCFLFSAIRRLTGTAPACMAVAIFALNPNLLYLQSTPMSEAVLFATFLALFWGLVYYAQTGAWLGLLTAALAAGLATMTRYEGWFVLPFVAAYLLWVGGKKVGLIFCAVAGLAPLEDSAYARCKGTNKIKTYLATGVPPVASDVGYHRKLVRHGETGFLVNTSDEWVEALLTLLRDPALVARAKAAARHDAVSKYSHTALIPKWAESLRQHFPTITSN